MKNRNLKSTATQSTYRDGKGNEYLMMTGEPILGDLCYDLVKKETFIVTEDNLEYAKYHGYILIDRAGLKTTEDYIKELTEYAHADWERKGYLEKHKPVYTYTRGKKFDKVLETSGMSTRVHCFIDRFNGDLYKAAGYNARANHVRGNINDDKKPFLCGQFYIRM